MELHWGSRTKEALFLKDSCSLKAQMFIKVFCFCFFSVPYGKVVVSPN